MSTTNAPANHESQCDLALLQGVWAQTRLEADGVVNPADDHGGPGALTTFAGNAFSVRTIDGSLLLQGAFELDASSKTKSITWIDSIGEDEGKRLPASYALEEDRFEFIAGNEDEPRPTEFRTKVGQTMRTFERR